MNLNKKQIAINIIIIPIMLYSLVTVITCTVNYIVLPLLLITGIIFISNNKLLQDI